VTGNKQTVAYNHIRSRIEKGEYSPGQRLVIDQLAAEIGISQVPIREAIRRLEAEYLVRYAANSGPMVVPYDAQGWLNLMESIAVLEGYATELAAANLTPADIQHLRQANETIRVGSRKNDLPEISRGNRAFHATVLARCPNSILLDQLAQAQARLDSLSRSIFAREQGVLMELLGPAATARAIADHDKLIAALESEPRAGTVERLTREHILVHVRAAKKRLLP
jgi:DNA-binding GntR family transcriptional regulator